MSEAPDLASGKGHKDENFPVASFIIKPRHRAAVMGFYHFARKADDVADHPTEAGDVKLELLERMRATLAGESDIDAEALALRRAQDARGLSPEHGLDLLEAFRRDVRKTRYADWAELMGLLPLLRHAGGSLRAGRARGEPRPLAHERRPLRRFAGHQPPAGLRQGLRRSRRVYIPEDALKAGGVELSALSAPIASPALRAVIVGLAEQTMGLLDQSRPFSQA